MSGVLTLSDVPNLIVHETERWLVDAASALHVLCFARFVLG